jgi:DNA (cytosine-5)-methyltransferase 1
VAKANSPVKVQLIDLFAGCGGLSCGFRQAADSFGLIFETAAAIEMDHAASATYAANFGDHVFLGKIESWLQQPSIVTSDIMVGGPPCQGFSRLGKQDPKDPRNKLWRSYIEAVSLVQPTFFVMENVPQFLSSSEYARLVDEVSSGNLKGYELQSFIISANHHGTAQRRKRAVVIGRLAGYLPVEVEPAAHEIPIRDAWGMLPVRVPKSKTMPSRRAAFRDKTIAGPFSTMELHVQGPMSERMRTMVKAIPAGGNRHDLPDELQYECWRKGSYGGNDVMGRMSWNTPSVTVRTQFFKPDKGRYIHPSADRAITYAEAALLQGFPLDYIWYGSPAQIAKQIGNAVPVPLAATVARMVFRSYLQGPIHGE